MKYQYSYSRIVDYTNCPFIFKTKYIDKLPVERPALIRDGAVLHDAIRMYNTWCIKNKQKHGVKIWKKCVDEAIKKENIAYENMDGLYELMKSYVDTHEIHYEKIVGVEERIGITQDLQGKLIYTLNEWSDPSLFFRLKVDMIEIDKQVARITDYKTGYRIYQDPLQLQIYAWGLSKIFPEVTTFEVNIDYVRHEFNSREIIDIDDIAHIEKKLLLKIEEIENDTKFKPQIGEACSWCGCWKYCPAVRDFKELKKVPTNEEEAREIAEELEKIELRKKQLTELLKRYCDDAGEISFGGYTYTYVPIKSLRIGDLRAFKEEYEASGGDFTEIVNIDTRKVKSLYSPTLQELVEKYGEEKVSTRFMKKKKKREKDDASEA